MLTKVIMLGGMLGLLVGCGSKPANDQTAAADEQQPAAGADFNNTNAAAAVTLPAGTQMRVRLMEALDTKRSRAGEVFTATLDAPVVMNEKTVVPKGTEFRGHVTVSDESGRLKGRADLGVTLDSFELRGKRYKIATSSESRVSKGHKKRNAVLIGGGAGLGAALGAVAGGGKGALIGAGAGAGAGTAGAAATGKEDVVLPAETPLTFSLRAPVRI
jgi:hypothetical protein